MPALPFLFDKQRSRPRKKQLTDYCNTSHISLSLLQRQEKTDQQREGEVGGPSVTAKFSSKKERKKMTTSSRPTMNGDHTSRPPTHHRHYYPTPYSSSSSSASFKGCCCCLFLLFSFLALLVLAAVLVVFLAVKPKKPQFDLQQVGVQYVGITPNPPATAAETTTPTSASVSLNIRLLFKAVNENKVGIKYGELRFTVMYRGIPLGRGTVPGFYQPANSVRQVETTVAVDRVSLMQADATELLRDATLNDRVELRVLGDVGAKIRILGFTSPGVQVSVDCAIVISPRKQALTYKQCGFDGLTV